MPEQLVKLGLSPAAKLPDRRDAGQMPRVRSGKTGRRFDQDHARADDLTHPPSPRWTRNTATVLISRVFEPAPPQPDRPSSRNRALRS